MTSGNIKKGEHKSPRTEFNRETAAKAGRNGAKKTNEIRRRKKTMRECLMQILEMKSTDKEKENITRVLPDLADEEKTKLMLICVGLMQKAATGDTRAVEKIMELLGEKTIKLIGDPEQPVVSSDVKIQDIKKLKDLIDKG